MATHVSSRHYKFHVTSQVTSHRRDMMCSRFPNQRDVKPILTFSRVGGGHNGHASAVHGAMMQHYIVTIDTPVNFIRNKNTEAGEPLFIVLTNGLYVGLYLIIL